MPPACLGGFTTTSDGSFNFLQLAVGDYNVTANKIGFETFTVAKIHLELNQVYVLPVQLTLGAMSQEITVQANPVQVDTTTPQLGTVVEAPQIVSLPLIGRNWQQLQQLQPAWSAPPTASEETPCSPRMAANRSSI